MAASMVKALFTLAGFAVNYVLWALLLAIAGLACWYFSRNFSRSSPRAVPTPVQDRIDTVIGWQPNVTRIMTSAEQRVYKILRAALPDHMVLSQVPLSRFMKVATRHSYAEWLRRVGDQCADFVVCDSHSKVLAVIEVQSEKRLSKPRALKRSTRKAKSLKAAGVTLHIWPEKDLPSISQVRQLIWGSSAAPTALAGQVSTSEVLNDPIDKDSDEQSYNDPPPSTLFDDLDSSPMPLMPAETARNAEASR
jgi:Protein of unknown function (DUF2726)